jgi:hypothetical protein
MDLIGYLQRLANKDVNQTFNPATDSLEAIRDYLATVVGDNQGLAYYGVVTDVPGVNQFTVDGLAGYGETAFVGWNAFVFWDAGGAGAAPQGEKQAVTGYTDLGVFTTAAFTAAVAVGDVIVIMNPESGGGGGGASDGVYVDVNLGGAGGTGAPDSPVDTFAAALPIALANKVNKVYINNQTDVELAADLTNYFLLLATRSSLDIHGFICDGLDIQGAKPLFDDTGGASLIACKITRCEIEGTLDTIQSTIIKDCDIVDGEFIADAGYIHLIKSVFLTPAILDTNGVNDFFTVSKCTGELTLVNVTDGGTQVDIFGDAGLKLTIDASCTAGTVNIYGNVDVTDNSAGSTVNDYSNPTSRAVPAADSADNVLERDIIGNKTDTNAGGSIISRHLVPGADSVNNVNARDVVGNKTDTVASGSLQGLNRVPAADAVTNANQRDIIGNKTDTAIITKDATSSAMRYLKGLMDSVGPRAVGKTQILEIAVTSAANAGAVTVATITAQPCTIKSVIVRSNGATTADLTSVIVTGGAGGVVTFIDVATGARANIAAADQQVGWVGAAAFAATKTMVITLAGTGATAVDLTVIVEYSANVDGGYLA